MKIRKAIIPAAGLGGEIEKMGYLQTTIDFALSHEDVKEEFKNYLKKKVDSFSESFFE